MRAVVPFALLALTAAAAGPVHADPAARIEPASEAASLHYPSAPRLDLVEERFGVDVPDPYRWLENDVRADPAVRDWVTAENAVTEAYLAGLPGRDLLRRRMERLYDYGRYSTPRKANGRYFYTFNTGLQKQAPLYMREGLNGPQREILDPARLSVDGATALAEWEPSPDGRFLLYAVQDAGSDWRTLRVLDIATGRDAGDSISWVKYSELAWDSSSQGFYYSRFDAPEKGGAFQSSNRDHKVYYHRLGTVQADDQLIFETPRHPDWNHSAKVTADGRWLLVTSTRGTDADATLSVAALDGQPPRFRALVKGMDHGWKLVGSQGSLLWFVTDKDAPRGRLVRLDAEHPDARPREIVPQREEVLAGGSLVGDRIIVAYLDNARTIAELVTLEGRPAGEVPMPGLGTSAGFRGKAGDPETFFSFSGFTRPSTIYRYDTTTGAQSIFAQPDLAFSPTDFVTDQIFYPSKDGTRIPMYIIRRMDAMRRAEPAPTLLYGYGGFNISLTPGFSPTRLAWLEQGGTIAIANLRGGGEYGKAWHDAGKGQNKQNVFDDFIAAAEYLKANGYTGEDQLAIEGRSNGGLLVGAVVNQRPDLFSAALPAVGVMDMLRFDRFTAGRYWVDDYGSPEKEADFRALLAYSPYHNIAEGRDYPAILVTTADTDDRVVPAHSFKYAAALQAHALGDRPRLIRVETRAGHGGGKPTDKLIEEYADMYAFAAKWTGLDIHDPD